MKHLGTLTIAAGMLGVGGIACSSDAQKGGTTLSAFVAPLDLPAATDACYRLTLWNDTENLSADTLVWDQPNLCASQYGNDNGIRFTGICDAQAGAGDQDPANDGKNAIRLVLNNVYRNGDAGNGTALTEGENYINPCPTPAGGEDNGCVLIADCEQNADTRIEFNLTVMRQATIGFFDTVVKFHDVFCAAKLDCEDRNGGPLTYLHDPNTDADGQTAVLGFTCLGGDGNEVSMYLDDVVITCRNEFGTALRTATVNPAAGPGNVTPTQGGENGDFLFGAAVNTGDGFQGSRYWNVLLGINESQPGETCTLEVVGTVSEAALAGTPFATPEHSRYPFIRWNVVLSANGARTCSRHPLNGGNGVSTEYTDIDSPQRLAHKLELQASCPCWNAAAMSTQVAESVSGGPGTYQYHYENNPGDSVEFSISNDTQSLSAMVWEDSCYVNDGIQDSVMLSGLSSAQLSVCRADLVGFANDQCGTNNGGCSGDLSVCQYAGPGEVVCVECATSADCTDPGASVCDTSPFANPVTQNMCVECGAPLFACPPGQWCNADGACAAPGTWFDYGTASFQLASNEAAQAVCTDHGGHTPSPNEIQSALIAHFERGVDFGITFLDGWYYGAPFEGWLPVFLWSGSIGGPWSNRWDNGTLLVCVPD